MRTKLGTILAVLGTLSFASPPAPARAAFITVYGGPTYAPGVGGFQFNLTPAAVNIAGTTVGYGTKYNASDQNTGFRAVRFDGSGAAATQLGNLVGTDAGESEAYAINAAGTAVGYSDKYNLSGTSHKGQRAVRWDATGTAAIELDNLGTDSAGRTAASANAINAAGTAVGYAIKYTFPGNYNGSRAVRWDLSGAATELGHLGLNNSDTESGAGAINATGTAVGFAEKRDDFGYGANKGIRAVRWDASGTAATELGNLGTDADGFTLTYAFFINDAGTVVGYASKYDGFGANKGRRAVRWDASGTAATELGNLGTDADGFTLTSANAMNDAGTVVGSASKYDGSGAYLGERAVRWDKSGAATELGALGTFGAASGFLGAEARAINNAGTAVGSVNKYDSSGAFLESRAVFWGANDVAIDLNTLIDPQSGWTLAYAAVISDTHFVAGSGLFDPDGPGGRAAYGRMFLMDISSAVPEPATVVLFGVALAAMFGSLSQRSNSRRTGRRTDHRHAVRRPSFEPLEDRCLLSFSPATSFPVGPNPQAVVAGDFNHDGHLDLATANLDNGAVSVLLGDGRGGFGAAIDSDAGAFPGANRVSLAVADFNKDGNLDLAVVNSHYEPREGLPWWSVNVLLSNGDGAFRSPIYYTGNGMPLAVAVGDFNNDGNSDLVLTEINTEWDYPLVEVLLGNGRGGFAPPYGYLGHGLQGAFYALAVGDLNGDGNLDVVTTSDGVGNALLGNGDGTFRSPNPDSWYGEFPGGGAVAVVDFTGDGIPDLAVASTDVAILVGRGDGTFFDDPINHSGYGGTAVAVADFNGDGKLDAVTSDSGYPGAVSELLGNGDGSLTDAGAYGVGASPAAVAVGDFNGDGRPDVAAANAGSNTVAVLLNDGNWPATSPTLPGDYNGNGAVDAADYTVWRDTLGSATDLRANGDNTGASAGAIDQADYVFWKTHFGETLPAVGAGSLVAAAPAIIPELSASVESVVVTERASASVESAEPDERGNIEPQGTSARDSALAVLHSWLPQFVPQGKATMRRLHALSTTESGVKARGNDLLLVRSSAARFDQQPSKRGLNSRLINDSTDQAVETHRESLDIAFTTLEHAEWQLGDNMLRRVWAGLWFAFVIFIGAHAKATPVVIDTNFGPGDSVKNSVHDVLNQQGYVEHAARFFVPMGTNFTFSGIDVPIQDALAANERIESQLSIRLWTDDAGQPGTLLESMNTDVIQLPSGYLIQHVDSTSNTTLLQNNYYWISLAAVNPGRVAWFVNNTETGGYALKSPTSGAPWRVIDTAAAGAFRVFGEAALVPEPSTAILFAAGLAAIGLRARREYRPIASQTNFERGNRPCHSTVGC